MPEVAGYQPLPLDEMAGYQRAGRALVAVDADDRPVAYLLADDVDGNVHVEQVPVHPARAHRRIGLALIEQVAQQAQQARQAGAPALTLTTFRDVPWNAPYYARCGFRVVDEPGWTPGLRRIRARAAATGLDRWPRVVMRRELCGESPSASVRTEAFRT